MSVEDLFDLRGKVAMVTGGSRGIGLQMAAGLGESGAKVAISARKHDELEAARRELDKLGIESFTVAADLAAAGAIPDVVDRVFERWQRIDILVNNAGCNWGEPTETYPDSGWRKVMALNIDAAFYLSREIGRRCMIPRRSGKIINIASVAALGGYPPKWEMATAAYNASKGALVSLTKALAAEWGPHNINVNAICPGFFPSKMTDVTLQRIGPQILELTPLGRHGGEEDLKGVVVFLASEASRHITGQVLAVDGGFSAL